MVCFYTPFGVRCFGTGPVQVTVHDDGFLYALRREVLRNTKTVVTITSEQAQEFLYALRREVLRNRAGESLFPADAVRFLYALRREVLRNPTPVDGSLTSMFGRPLHARPTRASTRSWNRRAGRCFRR